MLSKRRPSALRRRVRRYICIVLAAAVALTAYFEVAVRAQLGQAVTTGVRQVAENAINEAVSGFLIENADAGDRLSAISYSGSGEVTAVTTDPAYINFVKSDIAERAAGEIDKLSEKQGIRVPLGSFSGLAVLNELGPDIRLGIDTGTCVDCRLESSFESAGINQTVHHISLIVSAEVAVYSPFRLRETVKVSSDFEIAQTVIIGSVPSYGGVVTY